MRAEPDFATKHSLAEVVQSDKKRCGVESVQFDGNPGRSDTPVRLDLALPDKSVGPTAHYARRRILIAAPGQLSH